MFIDIVHSGSSMLVVYYIRVHRPGWLMYKQRKKKRTKLQSLSFYILYNVGPFRLLYICSQQVFANKFFFYSNSCNSGIAVKL